jgi:acetyl-CoA C-acetyltransferase
MKSEHSTPVIIGVGEVTERVDDADYRGRSPVELAAAAARSALEDAAAAEALAPHIDVVAGIRQFEISFPKSVAPFGRADNFPRAVAGRIGAHPARAILESVGGETPQHLVNEFAHSIATGEADVVLLLGAEAISTVRHLTRQGEVRDWNEAPGGQLEDRGYGESMLTRELVRHGGHTPITVYALLEQARRARLGVDRDAYRLLMGELFAPFTQVAAGNPYAMSRERHSAAELATLSERNRFTADPYPRRIVARDQVNQGAAVLMTSVRRARALGVPETRFIFLHGGADARERQVLERADLSASPAAVLAARQALDVAGRTLGEIDLFDFYSCFPIAVFNLLEGLAIAMDDPRPRTVTGGLPFFGGPGNNYSMHAIAAMTRVLRQHRTAFGMVAANGGFLSKCSVGIYSAQPVRWSGFDSSALQARVNGWPAPRLAEPRVAEGLLETYTVDYAGQAPKGLLVGTIVATDERFVAMTSPGDAVTHALIDRDPLSAKVMLAPDSAGRSIATAIDFARG